MRFEQLYFSLNVSISDREIDFGDGIAGKSSLKIQIPKEMINLDQFREALDLCVDAALREYRAKIADNLESDHPNPNKNKLQDKAA